MSAPYYWDEPERGPERRRGGTMCFVHTGSRLLGITAGHIHQTIVERLRDGRSTWCQVGGHTFNPEARLIDCNIRLDLATYDVSEIQVNAVGADIHHAPLWPPTIDASDAYVVGGWPWTLSSREE